MHPGNLRPCVALKRQLRLFPCVSREGFTPLIRVHLRLSVANSFLSATSEPPRKSVTEPRRSPTASFHTIYQNDPGKHYHHPCYPEIESLLCHLLNESQSIAPIRKTSTRSGNLSGPGHIPLQHPEGMRQREVGWTHGQPMACQIAIQTLQNHVLSFVPLLFKANCSRPHKHQVRRFAASMPPGTPTDRDRKLLKAAWDSFYSEAVPRPTKLATQTFQSNFHVLSFVPPIRTSHPPPPPTPAKFLPRANKLPPNPAFHADNTLLPRGCRNASQ